MTQLSKTPAVINRGGSIEKKCSLITPKITQNGELNSGNNFNTKPMLETGVTTYICNLRTLEAGTGEA